MPKLFNGRAFFSSSVPEATRNAWVAHGGTLKHNNAPLYTADYVFCNGRKDPWYPSFADKAIPVFHAQWVANVVAARFLVPIAPYTLNSHTCEGAGPLTRDDSIATLQELQYEERPTKMARRSLNEHRRNSLPFEEGHSAATLVDEQSMDSVKLPGSIPFIDFRKMKPTVKSSGAKLRISVVPQSRPSSSRSRSSSSAPLFNVDARGIPRISGLQVRNALRHIQVDKASLIKHNYRHLGKTFRCGFQP